MNAFPSVDTFFLLSGTMASYGLLRKVQNTRRFNPFMFYLLRVLRLVGGSYSFLYVYISFYSIYAYQILDLDLNNQKLGAFGPMPGPFRGPWGVNPHICISLYSSLNEYYTY